MKKVKVTFENLTPKQAKVLAEWYEGQGEQDACTWFDIHDTPTPMTDCGRKGGYKSVDKDGNITVYIKEQT